MTMSDNNLLANNKEIALQTSNFTLEKLKILRYKSSIFTLQQLPIDEF